MSPITVQKAFGEVVGVRVLRLAADEPDRLEAAIRSRLRSAEVDTGGLPILDRGNPGQGKPDLWPAFQSARTDSAATGRCEAVSDSARGRWCAGMNRATRIAPTSAVAAATM